MRSTRPAERVNNEQRASQASEGRARWAGVGARGVRGGLSEGSAHLGGAGGASVSGAEAPDGGEVDAADCLESRDQLSGAHRLRRALADDRATNVDNEPLRHRSVLAIYVIAESICRVFEVCRCVCARLWRFCRIVVGAVGFWVRVFMRRWVGSVDWLLRFVIPTWFAEIIK